MPETSGTFEDLREAIRLRGKHPVVAKVEAVSVGLLTVDVILEQETVVRKGIPLRIFNDEGGFGFAVVPKLQSEVLIGFVGGEERRPQVIKVQEWDYWVLRRGGMEIVITPDNAVSLKRESGFEFTITADDTFLMGNGPAHTLLQADRFLPLYNQHIHNTPNGPSSPPVHQIQDPECVSEIFTVE
jgi:hypothetical protein